MESLLVCVYLCEGVYSKTKAIRCTYNNVSTSFPDGSVVKNPPAMWEAWVQSLAWEDPPKEGMATHSSILAWKIPMDRRAWWLSGEEFACQCRGRGFYP